MRKKEVLFLICIYIVCVVLAGSLWHRPLALSLCYIAVSIGLLVRWHSKKEVIYYAVGFILGPAGELIAVYLGAWHYAKPTYLLPLWLPFLWGTATLFIMKLAEALLGE